MFFGPSRARSESGPTLAPCRRRKGGSAGGSDQPLGRGLGRRPVHVAGSKGKGSTAAMVESVLRAAGLTTGLYTSPHLHSYTERIRIDGRPLSEEEFAHLTQRLRTAVEEAAETIEDRQLVMFDLLTALAFLSFREHAVGVQVLEVGLGGRVDSPNVFEAKELAVITPT